MDHDDGRQEVPDNEVPEVGDASVEGEAHRPLVGVLEAVDAAVAVGVAVRVLQQVVVHAVVAAGHAHEQPELHARPRALGEQEALGEAAAPSASDVVREVDAVRDGLVRLLHQRLERDAVGDGDRRLGGLAHDVVLARLHCNAEGGSVGRTDTDRNQRSEISINPRTCTHTPHTQGTA